MDNATLVPVLGFAGTVVVALSAVLVAAINRRGELRKTGDNTLDKVLNQRILLRDEQNAELKQDLLECRESSRRRNDTIRELRGQVQRLEAQLKSQQETQ